MRLKWRARRRTLRSHGWARGLGSRNEADAAEGFLELLQPALQLQQQGRAPAHALRLNHERVPARGRVANQLGPDRVEPDRLPARGPFGSRRPGPCRGLGNDAGGSAASGDRVRASVAPPAG